MQLRAQPSPDSVSLGRLGKPDRLALVSLPPLAGRSFQRQAIERLGFQRLPDIDSGSVGAQRPNGKLDTSSKAPSRKQPG